jgi:hypothetical protein
MLCGQASNSHLETQRECHSEEQGDAESALHSFDWQGEKSTSFAGVYPELDGGAQDNSSEDSLGVNEHS